MVFFFFLFFVFCFFFFFLHTFYVSFHAIQPRSFWTLLVIHTYVNKEKKKKEKIRRPITNQKKINQLDEWNGIL